MNRNHLARAERHALHDLVVGEVVDGDAHRARAAAARAAAARTAAARGTRALSAGRGREATTGSSTAAPGPSSEPCAAVSGRSAHSFARLAARAALASDARRARILGA